MNDLQVQAELRRIQKRISFARQQYGENLLRILSEAEAKRIAAPDDLQMNFDDQVQWLEAEIQRCTL